MKNALTAWSGISKRAAGKPVFLFLDFDGTLASLAETPQEAMLPEETKTVLERLKDSSVCRLAVISGRAIEDIKERVGLDGIIYAGNHGLEIEGPKIGYSAQLTTRLKSAMDQIRIELKVKMRGFKGVLVEDKGLSLSVHYRRLKSGELKAFKNAVADIARPFLVRGEIKVRKGKKVIEIMPPVEWNKGSAVLWLLKKGLKDRAVSGKIILPIYLGDDATDEDAFRVLKGRGISVIVGRPKNTLADFNLNNTAQVVEFLKRLSEPKGMR